MGSAALVTAYLRAPAKRTVGVVRMTVGGMRIGVGGVRMAAGGMRIGVGACEWLSVLKNRVVSVLRANQCRLGMRISVGTNTNTQVAFPEIEESGAVVVGKGKPGFPGGTEIPPTKVDVVRPN